MGAPKFFCLWHRGSDNGYAADYGTSRRFQKYDVFELPQNSQTTLGTLQWLVNQVDLQCN